jgi:tetratricopeptide (TPR) repeat protein
MANPLINNKILYFIGILSFLFFPQMLWGQDNTDAQIAKQYFDQQEFEKSEILYKKLYSQSPEKYYKNYYSNLIALRKYNEAKEIVLKKNKQNANSVESHLDLGYIYIKQNDSAQAHKEISQAIEKSAKDASSVAMVYDFLKPLRQYQFIIQLFETAQKKQNNTQIYTNELIQNYLILAENKKAANLFVEEIKRLNDQTFYVAIQIVQPFVENNSFLLALEKQVYGMLTKEPNSLKWNEMALWLSLQTRNYDDAVRISKSLDKKNNENGSRLLELAEMAKGDRQFDIAIDCYDYVIQKKEKASLYHPAFLKKSETIIQKLENAPITDSIAIQKIKKDFEDYFNENGYTAVTGDCQILYAAFYLKQFNKLDTAIHILKRLLAIGDISKNTRSMAKLDLGDYLIMDGDIWEAALVYGQVGADEKDSPLGEMARFKNAKLFYYKGEFELAQELLNILKSATSELIANDALKISVFIQDHLDDEAQTEAMNKVADAELFFLQNQPQKAFALLDSAKSIKASESLVDDIWMLEAEYFISKKMYAQATQRLESLVTKYPREVLTDKALYLLADLYEKNPDDKEKAKETYLKILQNFKDSVYTTEARKRIRVLRGENTPED